MKAVLGALFLFWAILATMTHQSRRRWPATGPGGSATAACGVGCAMFLRSCNG